MYKYIFSDLDMTLLQDDKTISKENKLAIKKAQEKGVKFMFSTGRVPYAFSEYQNEIDISSYSSCNGAILSVDGKIIKDVHFEKEISKEIVEYGIKNELNIRIFTTERLYLINFDDGDTMPLRYKGSIDIEEKDAYKLIEDKNISKIAYFKEDRKLLEKAQEDLRLKYPEIENVFSAPTFLEFGMPGQNKGQGIKDFCSLTGAKAEEIICLGDNENDFSMMNGIAGLSACPKNAIDKIKGVCDVISPLTNNEGFVASIIEEYILKD